MKYIDIDSLNNRFESLKKEFHSKKPFKYLMFDNFFPTEIAEEILSSYPTIENGKWDGIFRAKLRSRRFFRKLQDEVHSKFRVQLHIL